MAILKVRDAEGNVSEIPAIKGKSAYEYAKDGGYTGTEEEFAELMANGTGGGLVGEELTQAEYNALPEEEKNNGLYFITDGVYEDVSDSKIIYEEYTFQNISFESGTVSTRATQYTKDIAKDGYRILSTTITYILESSLIIPIHFLSGSTLYLNIYRATANSMSNNEVRITVAYEKI